MKYPLLSSALFSLLLLLSTSAQSAPDCAKLIPDQATFDRISEQRFSRIGGQPAITNDEKGCLFRAEFQIWLEQNRLQTLTNGLDRRKLQEVDEFMAMNEEQMQLILGKTRGVSGRISTTENDRALVRVALYTIAERESLQAIGPDFLSTVTFLLTDAGYEANPVFDIFNRQDDARSTLLLVAAASVLGAELVHQGLMMLPVANRPWILGFQQLLRLMVTSGNNALLKNAGQPLTGLKVLTYRSSSTSRVSIYVYPVSRINRIELPRSAGWGIAYSLRF